MLSKTVWILAASFALGVSLHASSLEPTGEVVVASSGSAGTECAPGSSAATFNGFNLGGPGMCILKASGVVVGILRFGDVGSRCVADGAFDPCSGFAGGARAVVGSGLQQFRVNMAGGISGASPGRSTTGVIELCSVSCASTLASIPFQIDGNGAISTSTLMLVNFPANSTGLSDIVVNIRIVSMPAGAKLQFDNFVLDFLPAASGMGSLQICEQGGVGVSSGSPFAFKVEQYTLENAPVTSTITLMAGSGSSSCSNPLFFPVNSFVLVHQISSGATTLVGITGQQTDILNGAVGTVIGALPSKVTFTNKTFGNEGCAPSFYRNHPSSFPPIFGLGSPVSIVGVPVPPTEFIAFQQALGGNSIPDLSGPFDLLTRSSVTALLNAAEPELGFPLSLSGVVDLSKAAFLTGDWNTILSLSRFFDAMNNGKGGCPLP
jgi:hypothetical protein